MLEEGRVVYSIAGHDKDRFYAVVSAGKDRVTIADGKARKLGQPKAKNALHLRPTNTTLDMEACNTDKKLREALRPFNGAAKTGKCPGEGGN